MSTTFFFEPSLVVDVDIIFKFIKSFHNEMSCGKDGLLAQYILDAMCGECSIVARDLLYAITLVINLWVGGRCPSSFVEFVAFSPLTLLLKPDVGIQPIAVCSI